MKFWIDFGEKWTRRTRRTRSRSQKKKPPGQPIAIFKKGEERGRPVTCGYTTGQRTPGEIRIRVKRRCEHARARKSRRRKTYFIRYSFKGCRIEETRNCANLARLGRAHPRGRAGEEDCARERERENEGCCCCWSSPGLDDLYTEKEVKFGEGCCCCCITRKSFAVDVTTGEKAPQFFLPFSLHSLSLSCSRSMIATRIPFALLRV